MASGPVPGTLSLLQAAYMPQLLTLLLIFLLQHQMPLYGRLYADPQWCV
jgi:hypothetical protein